jgi:hypothetical protein
MITNFPTSPSIGLVNNDAAPQFLKFLEALWEVLQGLGTTRLRVLLNNQPVLRLLTGSG